VLRLTEQNNASSFCGSRVRRRDAARTTCRLRSSAVIRPHRLRTTNDNVARVRHGMVSDGIALAESWRDEGEGRRRPRRASPSSGSRPITIRGGS